MLKYSRIINDWHKIYKEERILSLFLGNPYIVQIEASIQDPTCFGCGFILEYCSKGSLRDLLKQEYFLSEDLMKRYVRQVASGLDALHQHKILHLDIKPENLLIRNDSSMVIADFDLSLENLTDQRHCTTIVGSPYYMAPEVISGKKYLKASDFWSLGVTLYESLTGNYPFDGDDFPQLRQVIIRYQFDPTGTDADEFLFSILTKDSRKRLTPANGFWDHPWIK